MAPRSHVAGAGAGAVSVRVALRQLEAVPTAANNELVAWFVPRSKQVGGKMPWFSKGGGKKLKQLRAKPMKHREFQRLDEVVLVGLPVSCWSIKSNGHTTRAGTRVPGDDRWNRLVGEAEVKFPGIVGAAIDRAVR